MNNTYKDASLVVVGSGIKFISHLTIEAKAYIEQSEKVLYLVNIPEMKEWIQSKNKNAESLDHLYTSHQFRIDSYQAITNYILQAVETNQHVCVVLYGHPAVFSQPALEAVIQAKKKGYYAKVLPGISAEDCLFADLLIDPGQYGCQSFEATDFLIHRRQVDPTSHLILWQVGMIGQLKHVYELDNTHGARVLVDYLSPHYSLTHKIIFYEAAQYPYIEPEIMELCLEQLPDMRFSRKSTLYIPPAKKAPCDETMLETLGMHKAYLKVSFR